MRARLLAMCTKKLSLKEVFQQDNNERKRGAGTVASNVYKEMIIEGGLPTRQFLVADGPSSSSARR